MREFFRHGLSLDEYKTSALILGFFSVIASIIVSLFTIGHIPAELMQLAETFIYAIAGVNAAHSVAKMVNGKQKNESVSEIEAEEKKGE